MGGGSFLKLNVPVQQPQTAIPALVLLPVEYTYRANDSIHPKFDQNQNRAVYLSEHCSYTHIRRKISQDDNVFPVKKKNI